MSVAASTTLRTSSQRLGYVRQVLIFRDQHRLGAGKILRKGIRQSQQSGIDLTQVSPNLVVLKSCTV